MDKSILRDFAIYSRNKLMQDVINKGKLIGISDKGIEKPLSESVDMLTFDIKATEPYKIHGKQVEQYKKLVEEIRRKENNSDYQTAYDSIVEEVAYTWFNRLIAIRFMEVNNYLPDKMRVLSSGRPGVDEPEFLTHYDETSLEFKADELEKILDLKLDGSAKSMEEIFHMIFIKECNRLNDHLPELFEKIDDYAELLLNISYIDEEGVLYKLVHDIPEEYFDIESENENGQVEIIGWMYQYYNSERKDQAIDIIGKGIVKKEDIPAATQLFTTDWVVRYMVDNSLGKYWLERNPNSSIKESLKYLMPGEIGQIDEKISPKDIKVFDNAMGSGHCLSYAFDVLMLIYESEGYTKREAARLILDHNLYGLDIDKRAYQLAYFAIMMKARQFNRGILNDKVKTNLGVFEDSIDIKKNQLEYLGLSMEPLSRKLALNQIDYLIDEFENAKELGSILLIDNIDKDLLLEFINDNSAKGQISIGESNIEKTQEELRKLVNIAHMIGQKYEVVVTNPPYLNKFSPKLKKYIWDNYSDYKGDLFSVFIYRNIELTKLGGYSAYMSPFVWMFIKTYEKLREYIIKGKHISSLIQMEYSAFEQATVPICTFVLHNNRTKEKGSYIRLSDFTGGMEIQRVKTLEAIGNPLCGYYHQTDQDNFEKIPGMPIGYWLSSIIGNSFIKYKNLGSYAEIVSGMTTGNNDKYMRSWKEVSINNIAFNKESMDGVNLKRSYWFPYNKGGPFRRWYGNNDYIVNWSKSNEFNRSKTTMKYLYLKPCITWSDTTSSLFSARACGDGFLFDVKGSCAFPDEKSYYPLIAFMNSKISMLYIEVLNPTITTQIGDLQRIPFNSDSFTEDIINIAKQNIKIARVDWDTFEASWDFKVSPLANFGQYMDNHYDSLADIGTLVDRESFYIPTIQEAYKHYKDFTNVQFAKLKANEEELNRIFIEIYGLEDELTPEVSDRDITIAKIFDTKEEIDEEIKGNRYVLTKEDVVKQFISYGVACIFGRYSLDVEGLAYAGGDFDDSKYKTFIPSKDNIILISDEEYLENDIVSRFIDFVEVVYGRDSLEENLSFIAESLGGKGDPKDIIRNYFLKDFYKDHVKVYQKRPIYWLYDSGRQNGFKALIYMHRYHEDTTGKVRISYLHEVQRSYERIMDNLKYEIANNENPRQVAQAEKRLNKLTNQLKECKDYDEAIGHLALARIPIDLDDGVKVNYEKVQTDEKGKKLQILVKI